MSNGKRLPLSSLNEKCRNVSSLLAKNYLDHKFTIIFNHFHKKQFVVGGFSGFLRVESKVVAKCREL